MEREKKIYIAEGIRIGIILIITAALMIFMNYSFHEIIPGSQMTEYVFEYQSLCMFIIGIIAGSAIMLVASDAAKQLEESGYEADIRLFRLCGILCVSAAELAMAILELGNPGLIAIAVMMLGLALTNLILLKAKPALDSLCRMIICSKGDVLKELFFEDEETEG